MNAKSDPPMHETQIAKAIRQEIEFFTEMTRQGPRCSSVSSQTRPHRVHSSRLEPLICPATRAQWHRRMLCGTAPSSVVMLVAMS
jgi:hypothetical protein